MAAPDARALGDEPPPEPPTDLARRTLRTFPLARVAREDALLAVGTTLWRVHDPRKGKSDPRWFGPAPGERPGSRFDDPLRAQATAVGTAAGAATVVTFGTCYLGLSREAAFAESFLRRPQLDAIDRATVDARNMAELVTTRALKLVALLGPGLKAAGATAAVPHGPQSVARRWARALWEHPSAPDGIAYRCRHDDAEIAIALFDRARGALQLIDSRGLREDRAWFGATLDRYQVALDPP